MHRPLAGCLTIAALVAVAPSGAHAQGGRTAFNTIFLELGGNGLIYSVNYERIMPSDVSLRAGFSYMSVSGASGTASANVSALGIPLTFSYLGLGGGSAKFELGAGATFERFSGSASTGFGDEIEAGAFVPLATFIAGLRIPPRAAALTSSSPSRPSGTQTWGSSPGAACRSGSGSSEQNRLRIDAVPAGAAIPAGVPGIVHLGTGAGEWTVSGLAPGEHPIIAVLAYGNHVPMEGVAADTVRVVVRE